MIRVSIVSLPLMGLLLGVGNAEAVEWGRVEIERWRAGVDILTLSKLMGHTSLQVLNRYLKQIGEDLERAAKQSSPVDRNF